MTDSQQNPQRKLSSLNSVSASSKVLGIPELVEKVLAELPARDLLMCECINKTWQTAINKSNTLQEKLFYKCDPVTLSKDMDQSDLEINLFFLLVQRRWCVGYVTAKEADGFTGFDYPNVSWKKVYLSRPAICKIGIQKETPDGSTPGSLVQFIQHDNIKMNYLLGSVPIWPFSAVRLSQSGGIRMHHLQWWNLSQIHLLTLNGRIFMHLTDFGRRLPGGCPETSLKQFYEMYVDRRKCKEFGRRPTRR